MKVGDLVVRRNDLVREAVGKGIVISAKEQSGLLFYQVQWLTLSDHHIGLMWYDGPELEVISESR